MGLKITTPIGTDQGITTEAYVRISSYRIEKSNGQVFFDIQIYQSQEKSVLSNSNMYPYTVSSVSRNNEIGDNLIVYLTKEVIATRTSIRQVSKEVDVTETITTINEAGESVDQVVTRKEFRIVEETYQETYTQIVPDFSVLDTVSIFVFAYNTLKEKLGELFGTLNVIDC